jgi:hypothetical protein
MVRDPHKARSLLPQFTQFVSSPIGVFAVLAVSAYLEVQGDACFQSGLYHSSGAKQIGWVLAGTALLVCYSLFLNSSKIDFGTDDLNRLICTEVKLLAADLGFLVSPRTVPFFSSPLQLSWRRRVCQLSLLPFSEEPLSLRPSRWPHGWRWRPSGQRAFR